MRRTAPSERAAFALSLVLLVLAWSDRDRPPEICNNPVVREPGEVVCATDPATAPRLEGPLRRLFGLSLDPNRADAITLETLPGIGPARASAIVRERCIRPFASVADVTRVAGIGRHRIRRLEPFLELEGEPAPHSLKSGTCGTNCEVDGADSGAGRGCALE